MKVYTYRVSLKEDGSRLDNSVTAHLDESRQGLEISRSIIQRLIKAGTILLNQKRAKTHTKVKRGDEVTINLEFLIKEEKSEIESKLPKPEDIPLDVIYEDEDLLAINKPAGMVVHPAAGNYSGTLVNALLSRPEFRTQGSGLAAQRFRPGIVHRLDKDTSGIILVAKNETTHRKLSKQLKARSMTKTYIAVVKGVIEQDEGLIDAPIAHDEKNRKKMAIRKDIGKEAVTCYRVIKRVYPETTGRGGLSLPYSILEVKPKTGRTHQIRVHLAHIGHPILGDVLYGGPVVEGLSRQALHAKSIAFLHPFKKEFLELSAEVPADLKQFLE